MRENEVCEAEQWGILRGRQLSVGRGWHLSGRGEACERLGRVGGCKERASASIVSVFLVKKLL